MKKINSQHEDAASQIVDILNDMVAFYEGGISPDSSMLQRENSLCTDGPTSPVYGPTSSIYSSVGSVNRQSRVEKFKSWASRLKEKTVTVAKDLQEILKYVRSDEAESPKLVRKDAIRRKHSVEESEQSLQEKQKQVIKVITDRIERFDDGDDLGKFIQEEAAYQKKLYDMKVYLRVIKSDPVLKCFYESVMYKLSETYTVAMAVNSGTLAIDTGVVAVDVLSSIFGCIPVVGNVASKVVTKTKDFVIQREEKEKASCITKFASTPQEFNDLMMEVTISFIRGHRDQIKTIDPKHPYLNSRLEKVKYVCSKFKELYEDNVYGNRAEMCY